MADVFISYKSSRRAAAKHLADVLTGYGFTVWWDYDLIAGRDFGAQLESELRAAKAVLVLWCTLSVNSEWVREEAKLARELDRFVPAIVEFGTHIPLGYSLAQTPDISGWDGAPQNPKLGPLLRDIGKLVGRAPRANAPALRRLEETWRADGALGLCDFPLTESSEDKATEDVGGEAARVRKRGLVCLGLAAAAFAAIVGLSALPKALPRSWETAITRTCWIVYDPTGHDPSTFDPQVYARQRTGWLVQANLAAWPGMLRALVEWRNETFVPPNLRPSEEEMRAFNAQLDGVARDLAHVRDAGFQGVLTYSSNGLHAHIPRLASAVGLRTIMGVWDPDDAVELSLAARQSREVTGYMVGHLGLQKSSRNVGVENVYTAADLRAAMRHIRRETGRPVSTILLPAEYRDAETRRLGDWLFPDVHDRLRDTGDDNTMLRDLSALQRNVEQVRALAAQDSRPILLAAVTYPWRGVRGASAEAQRDFFAEVIANIALNSEVLTPFVVHSAFDAPWKTSPPFEAWDRWTGVLEDDGTPRPAASLIEADYCGAR